MTLWLMTCTLWSANELIAERTNSCGISCCSIRIVAPVRYVGGQAIARTRVSIASRPEMAMNVPRRRQ